MNKEEVWLDQLKANESLLKDAETKNNFTDTFFIVISFLMLIMLLQTERATEAALSNSTHQNFTC